jgi:maltose alpha-D-glucosyltransferase/alpha-amylase
VHEFIKKESDAWELTLDSLRDFFDRAIAVTADVVAPPLTAPSLLRLTEEELPELVHETVGAYIEAARMLGLRTAQMHTVLASGNEESSFVPEAYTRFYQRSLYQSLRNITTNNFAMLAQHMKAEEALPPQAATVLRLEDEVLGSFRAIVNRQLNSMRIRTHGDYHLGQVLYTGSDFLITDFEGEPSKSVSERRLRRSPLRDVAGMLRSFGYAVKTSLQERARRGLPEEAPDRAETWGRFWQAWVSGVFLQSYLEEASKAPYLRADREEIELLLGVFMLEKAVYELGYELNNRPDWLSVPLQGILELLQVES